MMAKMIHRMGSNLKLCFINNRTLLFLIRISFGLHSKSIDYRYIYYYYYYYYYCYCLGVDGRPILEWTLKKYVSVRGIGLIRLRIEIIGEPL